MNTTVYEVTLTGRPHDTSVQKLPMKMKMWMQFNVMLIAIKHVYPVAYNQVYGGDQGKFSGTFTEVKQRRPQSVLKWVTVRDDRALRTCVRSSVCTSEGSCEIFILIGRKPLIHNGS